MTAVRPPCLDDPDACPGPGCPCTELAAGQPPLPDPDPEPEPPARPVVDVPTRGLL